MLWQVKEIGEGYSTPSIAGDRIYLLSNAGPEESAVALAVKDGSRVWATTLGKVGHPEQNPNGPLSQSINLLLKSKLTQITFVIPVECTTIPSQMRCRAMAVNAPSISPEDSSLQLKVKVELRINPKTELLARKINTSVRRRVVTLEGQVGSELDMHNAERVALSVPGITAVNNRLTVA